MGALLRGPTRRARVPIARPPLADDGLELWRRRLLAERLATETAVDVHDAGDLGIEPRPTRRLAVPFGARQLPDEQAVQRAVLEERAEARLVDATEPTTPRAQFGRWPEQP